MREFIYKKMLIFLIIFQPIIDIVTSYMTLHGYSITIGVVTKIFILFLACFYLFIIDKEKRKKNTLFLFLILIFGLLNIYNNREVIKLFTFTYYNYLFKYIYHIVILYFFIRWYKVYKIYLYELRIPMVIITFSYIISLITNSAYLSYDVYRMGYSGWYSSANELGNLLVLLFPVSIYNAFHNKDGIKFDIVLVVLISFCLLMIGTKVGLFGFWLISLCYIILRIISIRKIRLDKGFLIVLVMLIGSLLCFNKLPTIYNIRLQIAEGNKDFLLSNRDKYRDKIVAQYKNASLFDKVVGLSYYEVCDEYNDILIIEQDFLDILFMYGIFGLLIILIFYSNIYIRFIKKYRFYRRLNKYSKKYLTVIIAISIEFAIAFISGHSLLSPSVSTYLSLLIAISLSLEFKNVKSKKSILISSYKNEYLKIDKSKYDVYVLGNGNNYSCINKYFDSVHFKSKLLRYKIVAYLLVRNQKFDIILFNSNDNFINNYLAYSKANEKYIVNDEITIKKLNTR